MISDAQEVNPKFILDGCDQNKVEVEISLHELNAIVKVLQNARSTIPPITTSFASNDVSELDEYIDDLEIKKNDVLKKMTEWSNTLDDFQVAKAEKNKANALSGVDEILGAIAICDTKIETYQNLVDSFPLKSICSINITQSDLQKTIDKGIKANISTPVGHSQRIEYLSITFGIKDNYSEIVTSYLTRKNELESRKNEINGLTKVRFFLFETTIKKFCWNSYIINI